MTAGLTPEERAALTPALLARVEADPGRWMPVARAHASQRRGLAPVIPEPARDPVRGHLSPDADDGAALEAVNACPHRCATCSRGLTCRLVGGAAPLDRCLRCVRVGAPPTGEPIPADAWLHAEHLASWTGYGQIGLHVAEGLAARGLRVAVTSRVDDETFGPLPAWVTESRRRFDPTTQPVVLQLGTPTMRLLDRPGLRVVAFTMWEVDRLPPKAVEGLNRAAAVVVPCLHNRDVLWESGVTVPVFVVPMGVDAEVYRRTDDPPMSPFVFGCAGRTSHGGCRKNLEGVARAFALEADAMPDARLEVKCWSDDTLRGMPDHPRISINRTPMAPPELAAWYRSLSVYVTASRGEGFGLQSIQAMAVGRPVIAVPWSATVDFWDASCGWPIPYRLGPAGDFYTGYGAKWANPDEARLRRAMRMAYTDRAAVVRKGRAAARRAAEYPWVRTAAGIAEVLAAVGRQAEVAA